jgi:hypothetical protein
MSVDSMGLHSHGDSILQNKYVQRVGLVALIPYPCSAIVPSTGTFPDAVTQRGMPRWKQQIIQLRGHCKPLFYCIAFTFRLSIVIHVR